MLNPRRQRDALQIIFAVFLGLMVTAFIGMGVYTFFPPGLDSLQDRLTELRREQQDLRHGRVDSELSEAQRTRLDEIEKEIREGNETRREREEGWARTTSIILMILSTLVMGVSLIRADQLPVISNGLLLGGVFTMLYGMGWTVASRESQLRFWLMAFALLVTLGLGYVRFVRVRAPRPTGPEAAGKPDAGLQNLEGRVAEIERRLDAAGEAFRGHSG